MATNYGSLHPEISNYDFRSGAKGSVLVIVKLMSEQPVKLFLKLRALRST